MCLVIQIQRRKKIQNIATDETNKTKGEREKKASNQIMLEILYNKKKIQNEQK